MLFLPIFGSLTWAGCAQPEPFTRESPPADDLLAGAPRPLAVETLPGDEPQAWPLAAPFSDGAWLLPWHDRDGWHLRRVSADGSDVSDRDLDGELDALLPLDGGFAAVTPGAVRFLDGDGNARSAQPIAIYGVAGAAASDGRSVLVTDGVRALLVDARAVRALALPEPGLAPLIGDAEGFIVGNWLIDPDGALHRAPAPTLPDARLYLETAPAGDSLSLDGSTWVDVGGTVTWADRDPAGATAVVARSDGANVSGADGSVVVGLRGDGDMRLRAPLPRSQRTSAAWLAGRLGSTLVWEGADGPDRVITVLDDGNLMRAGAWARVSRPLSRAMVVSPGDHALLLAWLGSDRHVRYSVFLPFENR